MPTENRSSNTEMVSGLLPCPFCGQQDFLIERLDSDASVVICQGLTGPHESCLARGPVGVVQDEGEEQPGHDKAVELWNERAEQHQGEADSYPSCDYCGITPDHHPWHGSGLLDGVENRHIHACDGCRGRLPLHPGQHQGEPIAWVVGSAIWWSKHQAEVDAELIGEPAIPLGRLESAGEVERLRAELAEWKERCQRNNDQAMEWMRKHDTLRVQVAELNALLEEAYREGWSDGQEAIEQRYQSTPRTSPEGWERFKTDSSLSASAESPHMPDPLGCNECAHPECGKFAGPRQVECRAMTDNACARPGAKS